MSDLNRMLRELGAEAPPASAIPTGRVMRRIRRARQLRQAGAATLSVVATASAVAAVAFLTGWGGGNDRPAATQLPAPSSTGPSSAGCAAAGGGVNSSGSPLTMTVDQPVELSPAAGTPQASITVTNTSGAVVTAMTSIHPEVVLVRDGRAVTAPAGMRSAGLEIELAPGASRTFSTPVSLTSCTGVGPAPEAPGKVPVTTTAGPTIEPGEYLMYATQTFLLRDAAHPDSHHLVEVHGGPWQTVLR